MTRFLGSILLVQVACGIAGLFGVAAADEPLRPHFYPRVRVLAIGVDEFASAGIPQLLQAEADAREFAALLRQQFGFETDVVLGSQATKAAIESKLDELQQTTAEDEALILYLATHGHVLDYVAAKDTPPVHRRVGYLLVKDSDIDLTNPTAQSPEQWQEQALSMRWLIDRINELPTQHVLLIADTCCSGFLTKRGGASSPELFNLLAGTSRTVLAATTQNEAATGGFFTPILRDTLTQSSRDAQVLTVTDLFQTLRRDVAQATQGRQTPQLSHVGKGDGEFLFFPLTLSEPEIRTVQSRVAAIKADMQQPAASSSAIEVSLSQLGALRGVAQRVRERADRKTTFAELVAATTAPAYWYGEQAAGETRRWSELRDRFRLNASWGDGLAMAALHVCAARGLGEARPEPDPDEAYRWALATLDVAQPPGLGEWAMGRCYSYGWGVSANQQSARRLYEASHEQGQPLGTHARAYHLMVDEPNRENVLAARALLQPLADELPQAATLLAQHYRGLVGSKLGFPTDFATAMHYDQLAYERGSAFGGLMLYAAYAAGGPGLPPRDLEKAAAYLREAASQGDKDAQTALASECGHLPYYQTNYLKLPKDVAQARHWLMLAAEQGSPRACYAFGRLLVSDDHELGVSPDPVRARTYLDRAEEGGYLPAIVRKSTWLFDGTGPYAKDEQQAFRLARTAAERGDPNGCALLGVYYEGGLTLDLTAAEQQAGAYHRYSHFALHWYMQAVLAGGNSEADAKLSKFRGHLRLEKAGLPYANLTETWPTDVMNAWREDFPATARRFEQGE